MLVYKFINLEFGKKSLVERRLKISRIHELNDPFELIAYDLTDKAVWEAIHGVRKYMANTWGLLCFSKNWHNPVLWAHYADKHHGICLGFDIPDEVAKEVEYVDKRKPAPETFTVQDMEKLMASKSIGWAYEKEVRFFVPLENEENGLYFKKFDDLLVLKQVVLGMQCEITPAVIQRDLMDLIGQVKVIQADVSLDAFKIIQSSDKLALHSLSFNGSAEG